MSRFDVQDVIVIIGSLLCGLLSETPKEVICIAGLWGLLIEAIYSATGSRK